MCNRIYKSREEKDRNFILDDRHELLNIYKSKCSKCKYFEEWDYFCISFPNGIPDEYLSGDKIHGDTVFCNFVQQNIIKIKRNERRID
jgi:hypothetical protein